MSYSSSFPAETQHFPGIARTDEPSFADQTRLDARDNNLEILIERSGNDFDSFLGGGNLESLDASILGYSRAISLTPPSHSTQAPLHHNLAYGLSERFRCLEDAADLDRAIECWIHTVYLTAEGDPHKIYRINNLGNSYIQKFRKTGDIDALNNSIIHFDSAVSLAASSAHPSFPGFLNNLGSAYCARFERLNEASDIETAISHQTRAVALVPSDYSGRSGWLENLGSSYERRFRRQGKLEDINIAIDYLSQAVASNMEGDEPQAARLSSLGTAYQHRSERSGSISDIDEAISCLVLAISMIPNTSGKKASFLNNLGVAYGLRQQFLGGSEDIKKGIKCQEEAARFCPAHEINLQAHISSNLGGFYRIQFLRSKNLDDFDLMIHHTSQAASIMPDEHPDKPFHLNNIAVAYQNRFDTSQDPSDLDTARFLHLRTLDLCPEGHPYKHKSFSNLGDTYYELYRSSADNAENLDQAIKYQLEGLRLCPDDHVDKIERLLGLTSSTVERCRITGTHTNLQVVLSLVDRAARSPTVPLPIRFRCAKKVTSVLEYGPIQQLVKCWETVMDLLPGVVWLGHPVSRRYQDIVEIGDVVSNAVATAIADQQYDTALEWVETGHSIIWKQIMQLRTPLDDLKVVEPALAADLERVSCALEQGSGASLPCIRSDTDGDCIVSVETTAQQHHRLAMEWDRLVLEVRSKPSFENFLRPEKTNVLLKAAHSGDIVAICVGMKSCGALVVRKNSTKVEHLPLPDFSHEKATSAYKQLKHVLHETGTRDSAQRKFKKGHAHRWGDLRLVLALLWADLVKPVLDYLGHQLSDLNDLPRLTWCTTGPLSFLPLHAAGIYPSSEKVFNYVISSYTPTLSALIHHEVSIPGPPCVLAVGQSGTPGQVPLPGVREELERVERILGEHQIVRLEEKDATIDAVLNGMESHSWIHFACHASQNSTAPGTSAFHLYDGFLGMSTIMNKPVKHAEFAFLSACQTASGDEDLPDEAVHLAAGMLMAGYRAVIATMWSIRDKDAPMVAEKVYAHMVQDGKADSQKAAQALHLAVKALREKVGEDMFESWVPFVHIGV